MLLYLFYICYKEYIIFVSLQALPLPAASLAGSSTAAEASKVETGAASKPKVTAPPPPSTSFGALLNAAGMPNVHIVWLMYKFYKVLRISLLDKLMPNI